VPPLTRGFGSEAHELAAFALIVLQRAEASIWGGGLLVARLSAALASRMLADGWGASVTQMFAADDFYRFSPRRFF